RVTSSRLALLDWDNTLHAGFTMTRWTHFLSERGLFFSGITTMISDAVREYVAGRLTYEWLAAELPAFYAEGLAGRKGADIRRAAESFVQTDNQDVFPFARLLLKTLRTFGIRTAVISGCPMEPLVVYRSLLEFDDIYALTVASSKN